MQSFRASPKHRRTLSWFPALLLCWAAAPPLLTAHAQTTPAAPPAPSQAQPAPAPQPATPPPPLVAAAAPATVALANGELTVNAQNSDLRAILQQIARASGMSIDGLSKTTRVFGVYGPGNPRDVLSDLLAGSDYNFVMLGGGNGSAPAKLVLTEKSAGPRPSANAAPAADDDPGDSGSDDDADQEPLGPGAIPHPSPQFTDTTDPQTRAQQNLQRLQQMHQQMLQQQQQQANPQ
jgi:hypothetical protein